MKKQCTKCKKEKNYSEFFKDKRTKDGLYSACKGCHYDSQKSWRERNRNNSNEYLKKWQKSNREKINQNHRGNPKYRLDQNMATSICNVLQGRKAGRTWKSLVGYSIDDLIRHLEKQFDDKMTWDNTALTGGLTTERHEVYLNMKPQKTLNLRNAGHWKIYNHLKK